MKNNNLPELVSVNSNIYQTNTTLKPFESTGAYRFFAHILKEADGSGEIIYSIEKINEIFNITRRSEKDKIKIIDASVSELVNKNIFRYKDETVSITAFFLYHYERKADRIRIKYNTEMLDFLKKRERYFLIDTCSVGNLSGANQVALYWYLCDKKNIGKWNMTFDQLRFVLGLDSKSYNGSRGKQNIISTVLGIKKGEGNLYVNTPNGNLQKICDNTDMSVSAYVKGDSVFFQIEKNEKNTSTSITVTNQVVDLAEGISCEKWDKWKNIIKGIVGEQEYINTFSIVAPAFFKENRLQVYITNKEHFQRIEEIESNLEAVKAATIIVFGHTTKLFYCEKK